ncbi:uncharacterized protein METZ01_LOCUS394004 [marine metagenome]|uniref:Phytanoyl-CoA dioxygenase n=1 Tax=marine metagenome TaxID=408172 RepID=A0A382V3W9_9ZZZZ
MKQDGYIVKKFLTKKDFILFKSELEKFVRKQFESLNIEIDDLTQYHNVVDDDTHYKVYKKLYDSSFFDEIDFDITLVEKRISEILNSKLVIKDDYYHDSKKINIRIIRPNSNDYSPVHRDSWLDKLKESGINLYVPLWGSNENSSLAVIKGSHKWVNLKRVEVDNFTVPQLVTDNTLNFIRPNPSDNEVLIFYPKTLHSGLGNYSSETRFSLEVRLYE